MDEKVKFKIPKHGNLQQWSNQGVLLLNATLTGLFPPLSLLFLFNYLFFIYYL